VPEHYDNVIYGCDWGFKNPSCILAIGIKDEADYVLQEFYQSRVTDDELIGIAEEMQQKWGIGPFYCDPSEPASIEKFHRAGIRAERANNDVNAGIRAVASRISTGKLFIHERCQNLINELNMYQYADDEKDRPVKLHDHAMDALRYALIESKSESHYAASAEMMSAASAPIPGFHLDAASGFDDFDEDFNHERHSFGGGHMPRM